jgi:hypothetical protein
VESNASAAAHRSVLSVNPNCSPCLRHPTRGAGLPASVLPSHIHIHIHIQRVPTLFYRVMLYSYPYLISLALSFIIHWRTVFFVQKSNDPRIVGGCQLPRHTEKGEIFTIAGSASLILGAAAEREYRTQTYLPSYHAYYNDTRVCSPRCKGD